MQAASETPNAELRNAECGTLKQCAKIYERLFTTGTERDSEPEQATGPLTLV